MKKVIACLIMLLTAHIMSKNIPITGPTTISFTINTSARNDSSQEHVNSTTQSHQEPDASTPCVVPLIKNHRPIALCVAAAGIASTFGALWIVYYWYYYAIYSAKNWSSWYNTKTLEELYTLELENIKKEFIEALRKRYAPFSLRPHLGHTLFNFEKDIIEEITMLNNYLNFHQFVRKTHLYWLLPAQRTLQSKALQNLQRLDFLQHLANKVSAALINS